MHAFFSRTIRASKLAARDGRIPRPIRWLAALGLLPVPGPLDEAVLLLVGLVLFAFYRRPLREAWTQADLDFAGLRPMPPARVEAREEQPRRVCERTGQPLCAWIVHEGRVLAQREQRLELRVEDDAAAEAVQPHPRPLRKTDQQLRRNRRERPARVAQQTDAGERLRSDRLCQPRGPARTRAVYPERVLVGCVKSIRRLEHADLRHERTLRTPQADLGDRLRGAREPVVSRRGNKNGHLLAFSKAL
jgi:hypothetical protein